ncbi:MAG: hypothetical protein HN742_09775 [Lentisphaerae bacterium]|nr:hypothetical protein [Lentisphaerota bacterium]MBT4823139.1 hypothetical protein [Lentisphaerota bacterium]MBT5610473.1 hypothetical protein [Lentisphaerota bacterium]MBT7061064.1 hypothetical protein [Lentisphaerota bacterium]MBT7842151.1 hypothetical protein [Lentisphaerota bacterium]
MNLLQNPHFEFHAFTNHRHGKADAYASRNVAFWNCAEWGDIEVKREAHVPAAIRPSFSTQNMVSIAPGKVFWQFATLPELGLGHGEQVSLFAYGHQSEARALEVRIAVLKLDSEDGTWTPSDFGCGDKRTFPRHSRGELVVAERYSSSSDQTGAVELRIDGAEIVGKVQDLNKNESRSTDINTIALRVELANVSEKADAWVWWPCLSRSPQALPQLPAARTMQPIYRHLPRTMQKLWKGEALHILAMGSSIDRGSANPPMYPYDEDPESATFKQPLSDRAFEADKVNRPDLDGYVGWWQHYWSYTGRLRLELMRKFNLPVDKILLNYMACDGSCVGEAHSGLSEYCSLSLPPEENTNGYKIGTRWEELHPELFSRPEGPRPDLVIFGSGANEKTDTPDEVAVFEGTIRWIQSHYPDTEFVFCQFQNRGGYTPNPGDLQALALRYQIPFLDYGKAGDDVTRWCNRYAFVPRDGHPQAASHYLWFKTLERAFECWSPTATGQAQLHLPGRSHANTYGWEGEMVRYDATSPRIIGGKFVLDDTAVNCWGAVEGDAKPVPHVDGVKLGSRRSSPRRDVRNSMFRHGRCRLGDRHVLEIKGPAAKLTHVDAKVCPNRRFVGIENALWRRGDVPVAEFASEWGAPYGAKQAVLTPGAVFELDVIATDLSLAYVDTAGGGTLRVLVDGVEKLVQPANLPFVDVEEAEHFMENRKGILGLGFGTHTVRLEAVDGSVPILGLFAYDSRPNHANERRLIGQATAGETITFSAPFRARPIVLCRDGLQAPPVNVSTTCVTFSGTGSGFYEVIGE